MVITRYCVHFKHDLLESKSQDKNSKDQEMNVKNQKKQPTKMCVFLLSVSF